MNRTLGILGAGDLGKQIANYAIHDNHYDQVVFFDDFKKDAFIHGTSDDVVRAYSEKIITEVIIGIGYNFLDKREYYWETFKNKLPFGKIIHTSSWVDKSATIELGSVIYPNCTIDKNVVIKGNSIVNLSCTIAHNSIVESSSFLAPSVSIAGNCTIGRKCFIGINSTFIDHLQIADNVKIGAGSVVTKNIDISGVYFGNPCELRK
jgi:sugar O-acyltransferase (sialic acid O-acetyltransferase NeuD family)